MLKKYAWTFRLELSERNARIGSFASPHEQIEKQCGQPGNGKKKNEKKQKPELIANEGFKAEDEFDWDKNYSQSSANSVSSRSNTQGGPRGHGMNCKGFRVHTWLPREVG